MIIYSIYYHIGDGDITYFFCSFHHHSTLRVTGVEEKIQQAAEETDGRRPRRLELLRRYSFRRHI